MKQKERILPSETLLLMALLSIGNTTNVFKTCHRIPLQIWLFRIMKNMRNNAWKRMLGGLPANSESWKFLLVESGILSLESGIQEQESGIPLTIRIRNPSSTEKDLESSKWNPESTVWNPESKSVLDSITRGDTFTQVFQNVQKTLSFLMVNTFQST